MSGAGSRPRARWASGLGALALLVATTAASGANRAPEVEGVRLSPSDPMTDTTLTAMVRAQDRDGDVLTYTYVWSVNGAPVAAETGEQLPGSYFAKGDQVTVEVTVSDGQLSAAPAASPAVLVRNSPPTMVYANGIPLAEPYPTFEVNEGEALVLEFTGDDPDGDPLQFSVRAPRLGAGLNGNQLVFVPTHTMAGTYEGVGVLASDGQSSFGGQFDGIVIDVNREPEVLAAGLMPQDPTTLDGLTADYHAVDPDGDTVTEASFDWYVNDVLVDGEHGASLSGEHFAKGDSVHARVRVSDGDAWSVDIATAPVQVRNTAPELTTVGGLPVDGSMLGFDAREGEEIVLELAATDVDGDELTFEANGMPAGAVFDGSTIVWTPGYNQSGSYDTITLFVNDGEAGDSTPMSFSVSHTNRPPEVTSAGITPGAVRTETEIEALYSARDPDGDEGLVPTYRWFVNDVEVAGESGVTLPTSSYAKDDTVRVEVTVSDGDLASEAVSSDVITVLNTAPEILSLGGLSAELESLAFDTAEDAELTLEVVATDVDGDELTFEASSMPSGSILDGSEFRWTPSYNQAGSYAGAVLAVSDGHLGDSVTFDLEVSNTNRAPEMQSVGLTPTQLGTETDVEALYSAVDPDGDEIVSVSYRWFVNDAEVGAESGAMLTGASYAKNDTVRVEVSVSDGDLTSATLASNTLTVINSPPEILSIGGLVPGEQTLSFGGAEGAETVMVIVADDPDGDELSYDASGMPAGSALDGNALVWTPEYNQAGTYEAAVLGVSDGELSTSVTLELIVSDTNRAPIVEDPGPQSIHELVELGLEFPATDPDGDTIDFLVDGLPAGASFDAETGAFSWTPEDGQAGSYTVTVTAIDDREDAIPIAVEVPIDVSNINAIQSGDGFTLGLDDDGRLAYFGRERNLVSTGELGGFYLIDLTPTEEIPSVGGQGFVDSGDGTPAGWLTESSLDVETELEATEEGHSVMRIHTTSHDAELVMVSNPISLDDGGFCRLELSARTDYGYIGEGKDWDEELMASVSVRWMDGSGELLRTDPAVRISHSTQAWKRLASNLLPPVDAAEAVVELLVSGAIPNIGEATLWIDDIRFGANPLPKLWPTGTVDTSVTGQIQLDLVDADSGLGVTATLSTDTEAIRIDGELYNTHTGNRERAVELGFAVPMAEGDWNWWDDLDSSRPLDTPQLYSNTITADETGRLPLSVFPIAAVEDGEVGYGLAWPIEVPRIARSEVDGKEELYSMVFSLGLSEHASRFQDSATFSLMAFAIDDPDYGLRSAAERYYRLEWGSFAEKMDGDVPVRSGGEGVWLEQEVDSPGDFNVLCVTGRYHTQNTQALDYADTEGLCAANYTRPWDIDQDIWPLDGPPPTYDTFVENLANEAEGSGMSSLRISGGMLSLAVDTNGDIVVQRVDESKNGAEGQWNVRTPLNLDPELTGDENGASVVWDHDLEPGMGAVRDAYPSMAQSWFIDGFFSSSAHLDNSSERFDTTDLPLTFSPNTLEPALALGLTNVEFLAWMTDRVLTDDPDILIVGNFNVEGMSGLGAPYVDAFVYEIDAHEAEPTAVSFDRLYRRFLAYQRPVSEIYQPTSATVWDDYEHFESEYLLRNWHGAMAAGIHPSALAGMFEIGLDPEGARPVYQQLVPVVLTLQNAGWEPVPHASTDDSDVTVERFGGDDFYLSVFNSSDETRSVSVEIDLDGLDLADATVVDELVGGVVPSGVLIDGTLTVDLTLEAGRAQVLEFDGTP